MEEHNINPSENIVAFALEFEAMQESGNVSFLEKEAFISLILYYETVDLGQALKVTEFALEQYPFSDEFFYHKAQLLIQSGKPSEALAWLSEYLLYGSSELEAAMLSAEAYLQLKRPSQAMASIRSVSRKECSKEDLSDIYYCEGIIYEFQEDFNSMFHSLRRSLLMNPHNESALERIWLSTEYTQKYEASINLHQLLLDKTPYSYLAWYNLGNAYACMGEWEKAIEAFEYTIVINDQFDYAYRDAIAACLAVGKFSHALKLFEDLREFQPPDAEILLQAGECHENENDTQKAIQLYFEAIRLNPDEPDIHYRLGKVLASINDWQGAIDALEKAVSLDNRKEEYLIALAESCYQLGHIERAGDIFQKATEVAPEQANIWIQYASFLIAVNDFKKAYAITSEGKWYINSIELNYLQSACLFLLGRKKLAKSILIEALSENYAIHEILFEFAPQLADNKHVITLISSYKS